MGEHAHDHPTWKTFLNVLIALLILTIITVAVAQVDFGPFNALVAMGVATVKATLVLAYFMHLKYDSFEYPMVFFVGVFFLFVMFLIPQIDIITRVIEKSTL